MLHPALLAGTICSGRERPPPAISEMGEDVLEYWTKNGGGKGGGGSMHTEKLCYIDMKTKLKNNK